MNKKIMALVLSVMMAVSLMCSSVFAEPSLEDGGTATPGTLTGEERGGPPGAVFVKEPVEDAGTSPGVFLEDIVDTLVAIDMDNLLQDTRDAVLSQELSPYSAGELQLVNMAPAGAAEKLAVVYGVQVVTGWQQEGGYWYYYKNGVRQTGWIELLEGGVIYYYYLDPADGGRMVTGLKTITSGGLSRIYYFTANGPMGHGWYRLQLGDDDGYYYYYFGVPGNPSTGYMRIAEWIQDIEASPVYWYYLGSDGHMYSYQWLFSQGGWYYFAGDGHMLSDTFSTIAGEIYHFSADGPADTGWFQVGSDIYHADTGGALDRGTVQMSDYVQTTFSSAGKWQSDTMVDRGNYLSIDSVTECHRANVRCAELEVIDGYRRPSLAIGGTSNFNSAKPNAISSTVSFFASEDTDSRVELLRASNLASADIVVDMGDLYDYKNEYGDYPTGMTFSYNVSNYWFPRAPEGYHGVGVFDTGTLTGSIIILDTKKISALNNTYFDRLLYHEIGHAFGLRHPYEPRHEYEPAGSFKALMWPYYDADRASDSVEDYDRGELIKSYP